MLRKTSLVICLLVCFLLSCGLVPVLSAGKLPDLLVENITYQPKYFKGGDQLTISVVLKNIGGPVTNSFKLVVIFDNQKKNVVVPPMEAYSKKTVSTQWQVPLRPTNRTKRVYAVMVVIDPSGEINEGNKRNNMRVATLIAGSTHQPSYYVRSTAPKKYSSSQSPVTRRYSATPTVKYRTVLVGYRYVGKKRFPIYQRKRYSVYIYSKGNVAYRVVGKKKFPIYTKHSRKKTKPAKKIAKTPQKTIPFTPVRLNITTPVNNATVISTSQDIKGKTTPFTKVYLREKDVKNKFYIATSSADGSFIFKQLNFKKGLNNIIVSISVNKKVYRRNLSFIVASQISIRDIIVYYNLLDEIDRELSALTENTKITSKQLIDKKINQLKTDGEKILQQEQRITSLLQKHAYAHFMPLTVCEMDQFDLNIGALFRALELYQQGSITEFDKIIPLIKQVQRDRQELVDALAFFTREVKDAIPASNLNSEETKVLEKMNIQLPSQMTTSSNDVAETHTPDKKRWLKVKILGIYPLSADYIKEGPHTWSIKSCQDLLSGKMNTLLADFSPQARKAYERILCTPPVLAYVIYQVQVSDEKQLNNLLIRYYRNGEYVNYLYPHQAEAGAVQIKEAADLMFGTSAVKASLSYKSKSGIFRKSKGSQWSGILTATTFPLQELVARDPEGTVLSTFQQVGDKEFPSVMKKNHLFEIRVSDSELTASLSLDVPGVSQPSSEEPTGDVSREIATVGRNFRDFAKARTKRIINLAAKQFANWSTTYAAGKTGQYLTAKTNKDSLKSVYASYLDTVQWLKEPASLGHKFIKQALERQREEVTNGLGNEGFRNFLAREAKNITKLETEIEPLLYKATNINKLDELAKGIYKEDSRVPLSPDQKKEVEEIYKEIEMISNFYLKTKGYRGKIVAIPDYALLGGGSFLGSKTLDPWEMAKTVSALGYAYSHVTIGEKIWGKIVQVHDILKSPQGR